MLSDVAIPVVGAKSPGKKYERMLLSAAQLLTAEASVD